MSYKLSSYDYDLPKDLIAQKPTKPRDHSRLLVLHKRSGCIEHKRFFEITDYLKEGDILILNNSKVFPARLIGSKQETGGKIEVFLLNKIKNNVWQCLIGGKGRKENLKILFAGKLAGVITKKNEDETWQVKFNQTGISFMKTIERIGQMPLPPYIKRNEKRSLRSDTSNYQTTFADNKKIGSVAAPTAGLHFTPALLRKIKKQGIDIVYITLHVGLGTFAPVKTDDITKHKMHSEFYSIKNSDRKKIIEAKKKKQRIITVGTTSTRTLESIFSHYKKDISGWTDIFIYPGYRFKAVDAMITNFHLPKSTLLMLVSALADEKKIKNAYKEAIKHKYRFYSYGDAMLII